MTDRRGPQSAAETRQRLRDLPTGTASAKTDPVASGWLPLVGSVSLAMVVVGVMLRLMPQDPALSAGMDDLEIFTAQEEMELYQNLDFYLWVTEHGFDDADVSGGVSDDKSDRKKAPDPHQPTQETESMSNGR